MRFLKLVQLLRLNAIERWLLHGLLVKARKARKEELLKHSITSKNILHDATLLGAYKVMPVLLRSFNPLLLVRYPLSNKRNMRCQFNTSLWVRVEDKIFPIKKYVLIDDALLGKIGVKYDYNKTNKGIKVVFNYYEIRRDIVTSRLEEALDFGCVYTVYIKVRYSIDRFFMVGNPFGFTYDNVYKVNDVFDTLEQRLGEYMSYYELTGDEIVYIELTFRKKDMVLLHEFCDEFKQSKHLDRHVIEHTKKLTLLPISINEESLGKYLSVNTIDGNIYNIKIYINQNFSYASVF